MTSHDTTQGPRFVVNPLDLIVDAVSAVEPDLDRGAVESTVVHVADTRAKLRRLAQALEAAPDLLTSGKPEGPRLIELLIAALQQRGASRVVLPRCARCGRQRPLRHREGLLRLCESCGNKTRASPRLPCATCGRSMEVASWDRDGLPRCRQHPPTDADEVAAICGTLTALDTGLDAQTLASVVEQAVPKPFQQRQLAGDLERRPELLTGQGAHGSPRVLALIDALLAHGARTITPPACPLCHRTVALKYRREEMRCCRRCYEQPRRQPCSRCGRHQSVATRTPRGEPLCTMCMRSDPLNHEVCTGCGRLALAVDHDEHGGAVCKRCWKPPMATCSVCGKHRPCANAASEAPRCPSCYKRLHRAPCSRCGHDRIIWGRSVTGEVLCGACGRSRETCSTCGNFRKVTGRTAGGGPLCSRCYKADPVSFRACTECGVVEHLHHFGLCKQCAAPRQLRIRLAGSDGAVRGELEPVIAALADSDPARLLVWLQEDRPRQLLQALACATGPITHQALDELPHSTSLIHLRSVLVAADLLPERDEALVRFEQWLENILDEVDPPEDKLILRSFTIWFHLRQLRRRSACRSLTSRQVGQVRFEIRSSLRLLGWLRDQRTTLSTCTQSDIDRWLTSDQTGVHAARTFLSWAVSQGHASNVEIPPRPDPRTQAILPEADQRWTLSRRLLHDNELATVDRVSGCLVLLYGQPCTRIVRLKTSHVTASDRGVRLLLGAQPVEIPEPLGGLLRELVRTRRGHAVVGHTDASPWLFPGGRPGQHMSAHRLMQRLNQLGIPSRAGRSTALIELAGELPAEVLSQLLGIHVNTAVLWAQNAGNIRPGYAAAVSRRELSKNR